LFNNGFYEDRSLELVGTNSVEVIQRVAPNSVPISGRTLIANNDTSCVEAKESGIFKDIL
jgi:hypothetical protein